MGETGEAKKGGDSLTKQMQQIDAISKIICRTEGNQYKRQVAFMMVGPQGGRYIGNKGGLVMLQCPEYSAIGPITWIAIELQ